MTTDSTEIRSEADGILQSGLQTILGSHGEVHVVGSYALGLMTWRDLDIHVVRQDLDVGAFFDLGREIACCLKPHRMHFRDESSVGTPGLPRGFYWGIYFGDERNGAWKIDIWQTDRQAFDLVRRFGEDLSARQGCRVGSTGASTSVTNVTEPGRSTSGRRIGRRSTCEVLVMFEGFGRTFARARASRDRT